ncbi:gamma-glutamylcyclotransferase family protein [Acaryochloris marina]|uniref:Putative gamma-glutamylcyclotransferase n=1 Tax=Acaryochloris marina (strain MBIC 11017) TaxID=329726 RepID=B0C853_ACAM1|nr:gamma-glutamylcyclotransferase family protein [Acaryochloris marina]ABW27737.1 conserved hypothetical protein [Acaryochloris marina MBIC11017]
MTVHLFTYGTLTLPEVMQAVTGQIFPAMDALLPGYERFCVVDQLYPGMIRTGHQSTLGRIYFNIDPVSLDRLDYFEGDLYIRQAVTVILPEHSTLYADTYVVPPSHRNQLSQNSWSADQFRSLHLPQFLVQVHHWMDEYAGNSSPTTEEPDTWYLEP